MKTLTKHEAKLDYIKKVYKEVIESLTEELKDIESGDHHACDESYDDINIVFKKAHNISVAEINLDEDDSDHNCAVWRCDKRAFQEASGISPSECDHLLFQKPDQINTPFYYKIKA